MPNIKSAKKRVLVSKVNNAKNRAAKTEMKTMIKKFDAAVAAGEAVEAAYKTAVKTIAPIALNTLSRTRYTTKRSVFNTLLLN